MLVRELITRLVFDGDESKIKRFDGAVQGLAVSLGAALGAMTAATAGAFKLAQSTAQSAQEVGNFARVANAGVVEFQRWAAASATVGIEQAKLSDILKDVNDRVGDFNTTGAGPMADFFEKIAPKIGLTKDAFKDLSGPEALQLYYSSLEKAGASTQEMTFFLEAMASDSTLLIPLLQNGGQALKEFGDAAEASGAILTDEMIATSKDFLLVLGAMKGALTGIKNNIATELMPVLRPMIVAFTDFLATNRQGIIDRMADGFKLISEVMERMTGFVVDVFGAMSNLLSLFGTGEDATKNFMIAMAGLLFMFKRAWFFAGLFMLVLDDLVAWQQGQESVIGELIGSYDGWVERIKSLTDSLGGMETIVAAVQIGFAGLVSIKIARWLMLAAGAVKALTLAMAANPVGLLIIGIAAAVVGLIWLYKWVQKNEWIIEGLTAKYEAFKAKAAEFFKPAIKAWEDLKAAGDSFMAGNWLEGSAGLLSTMTNILIQLADLFSPIFLDPILALWGTSVADLGLKFKNAIKAGFDNTVKFFGDMIEGLKGLWETFVNWAKALAIDILPEWAVNMIVDTETKGMLPDDYLLMQTNPYGTLRSIPRQSGGATGTWGDDPKPAPVDPEFEKRNGEILEYLDSLSATPVQPGAGEVTGGDVDNSKVITLNAPVSMNITVPPGTTFEQLGVIRSEVDRAINREVNRAATALEG